jgi:hypothetical protein
MVGEGEEGEEGLNRVVEVDEEGDREGEGSMCPSWRSGTG